MTRAFRALGCAFAVTAIFSGSARADVSEITVAQQYGAALVTVYTTELLKSASATGS